MFGAFFYALLHKKNRGVGLLQFTIGKTKVYITFFFAFGMVLLSALRGGIFALSVLSAVLVHECMHLLCLYLCNAPPASCTVGMFGMRLSDESVRLLPYKKELLCTLSAPLVNFAFSLVLFPFLNGGAAVQTLFSVHFSLGFFNLLPFRSLDGGRSFFCLLCLLADVQKADRIMAAIEWGSFVFFLLFAGIYFFCVRREPSLIVFLVYLAFLLFFRK